jgi:hypothetical protein
VNAADRDTIEKAVRCRGCYRLGELKFKTCEHCGEVRTEANETSVKIEQILPQDLLLEAIENIKVRMKAALPALLHIEGRQILWDLVAIAKEAGLEVQIED